MRFKLSGTSLVARIMWFGAAAGFCKEAYVIAWGSPDWIDRTLIAGMLICSAVRFLDHYVIRPIDEPFFSFEYWID